MTTTTRECGVLDDVYGHAQQQLDCQLAYTGSDLVPYLILAGIALLLIGVAVRFWLRKRSGL